GSGSRVTTGCPALRPPAALRTPISPVRPPTVGGPRPDGPSLPRRRRHGGGRRNGFAGRGDLLYRLVPGLDPMAHRRDTCLVVQAGELANLGRIDEREHRPTGAGAGSTSR